MLRIIRLSAVALLAAGPTVAAAQGTAFEGRVTAEISGGGNRPAAQVVILAKGGKARMESQMGGMPIAMIMDYEGDAITTLMPPQKMYMKMSMKQAEEQVRAMSGATGAIEPPKVTRTGKRETIAGVSCEHVEFDTKGSKTDVCAASGMGFFGGGGRGGGIPAAVELLRREFKDGFFPLKIETIEGETRTTRMLVKTVEKQAVAAALFEVPAGYTEMQMPAMPGRP